MWDVWIPLVLGIIAVGIGLDGVHVARGWTVPLALANAVLTLAQRLGLPLTMFPSHHGGSEPLLQRARPSASIPTYFSMRRARVSGFLASASPRVNHRFWE